MKIQQIRNATLKVDYKEITFLIDPWLEDKGTGMCAPTVREDLAGVKSPMDDLPFAPRQVLEGVDYCLVTHVHPDHFTAHYLPKDIKIIAQNPRDKQKLADMGFTQAVAIEGDSMEINGITIIKAPAVHGDNRDIARAMGAVSGYILTGEEKSLYISGDTVFYGKVAETIKKYTPDVIAVNCCEATTPKGRLIMNLADVESVCRTAGENCAVIATHLDSVNHSLVFREDVRKFAREKGFTNLLVPENGESLSF